MSVPTMLRYVDQIDVSMVSSRNFSQLLPQNIPILKKRFGVRKEFLRSTTGWRDVGFEDSGRNVHPETLLE